MAKKTINSFQGTRMSGLLKEVFIRAHNGGITETQLDLLLKGKNPNNKVLCEFYEWNMFYKKVLHITEEISDDEYQMPEELKPGEHIILCTQSVTPHSLCDYWNTKMTPSSPILSINYGSHHNGKLRLKSEKSKDEIVTIRPAVVSDRTITTKVFDGTIEKPFKKAVQITLVEALLFAMMQYCKHENFDFFPRNKTQIKTHETFIVPCYGSLFDEQPAGSRAYPLLLIEEKETLSIVSSAWNPEKYAELKVVELQ